jgi:hypothetical protein
MTHVLAATNAGGSIRNYAAREACRGSSTVSCRVAGSPFSFRSILLRYSALTRWGSDEWRVRAVTLSPFLGRRVSAFLPLNAGVLGGVYP